MLINTARDLSGEEWASLEGRVDRIFRKANGSVRLLAEEVRNLLDELERSPHSEAPARPPRAA